MDTTTIDAQLTRARDERDAAVDAEDAERWLTAQERIDALLDERLGCG